MKQPINKETLQSIYGEPSQQLTDNVTRTLRNLPEKQPLALSLRRLPMLAAALMAVIVLSTGAIAATGGWKTISQWMKQDDLQTETAEEVLYETDQVRFVLVEKTLIGNQMVLAVLWQPKAPGLMVIPKHSVSKSWTQFDNIMAVPVRKLAAVDRGDALKQEDYSTTLQDYLEKKQLTPVFAEFSPYRYDFSLVVVWYDYLQDDGSVLEYITVSGVDGTQPLDFKFYAGAISHETMEKEYGYLNSNVPMTDEWCDKVKRTIDLPSVVNATPRRMADPQTFEIERGNTTVNISDLVLNDLPNGWTVQFHIAVRSDIDMFDFDIQPVWPNASDKISWKSLSEWQVTDQGYECDLAFMMPMVNIPDDTDSLNMAISLNGWLHTVTLPLKAVDAL